MDGALTGAGRGWVRFYQRGDFFFSLSIVKSTVNLSTKKNIIYVKQIINQYKFKLCDG